MKRNITAAQLRDVVQKAFKQWTTADCGGGTHPNFVVDFFPDVNCTEVTGDAGYKSAGPNYNIWIFDDDEWPYGDSGRDAIALTKTRFDSETGVIFDSDVELNSNMESSGEAQLTIGDNNIGYDLQSVVQHEAGHFLGLSHSDNPSATMYAYMYEGVVTQRVISSDDVAAICDAYPPGTLDPNCDPEPRHGFSTECTFDKGCCAIAIGHGNRTRGYSGSTLIATFIAIAIGRRKYRSR